MRVGAQYAVSVFNQADFNFALDHLEKTVPRMMHRFNADTIVVTGKSGIAMAFALNARMWGQLDIVVVRKDGERSHGEMIEGPDGHDMHRYIVLDDFFRSGSTVRNTVDTLATRWEERRKYAGVGENGPELVGVLDYSRYGTTHVKARRFTMMGQNAPWWSRDAHLTESYETQPEDAGRSA